VSFNQDKAIHLLLREITPGASDPADDLVLRLREIRDAKDDVLTDDEYETFRQTIITQIVDRVYVPKPWLAALTILCVGCLMLVAWCVLIGKFIAAIGGLVGVLFCVLLWPGLVRDYAAKRALPRSSRLTIVERLLQEQLITENEAMQYRNRIVALFPSDAA
jgi:hypothetical protein